MAKLINYVMVRGFCLPEDAESLKQTLKLILPDGIGVISGDVEAEGEAGIFTKRLTELSARIDGGKMGIMFIKSIMGGLDEYDRNWLRENALNCIDDDCNMYIRLSKEDARMGRYVLESRDCIHVRLKLAAYPKKRENALCSWEAIAYGEIH